MSVVAEKVIAAFESLPADDQQAVAREILRRLPALDSGPLGDDEVALAGDQLAAGLDREEDGSASR
jgi:hypothetical protein